MTQIASIWQIELLAMLALPPRRTLHLQTQEFEFAATSSSATQDRRKLAPQRKKTEQDRTK
jgi:hypothetical protein